MLMNVIWEYIAAIKMLNAIILMALIPANVLKDLQELVSTAKVNNRLYVVIIFILIQPCEDFKMLFYNTINIHGHWRINNHE